MTPERPAAPRSAPARRRQLVVSWAAAGVVVVVALAVGLANDAPPTAAERVQQLTREFACPTCDGQAVAESDALVSREIRAEIARRVQVGQPDDEIRGALAAAYGEEFLLTPSAGGASSLVWVLPVVALVVGLAVVVAVVVRSRPRPVDVSDADRRLVEQALQSRHPDPT
ncbi:MAG TPA: cytochrome c-type biogenesis protein CcmH [Acidimicrobiales bacterium]|nr:cytochrome c-type biogenesis protein CcmH [Acidimicrobiales bacterium]